MSLREKLAQGRFVTLVELEPPKGVDCSAYLDNARNMGSGVDAFVVPDMRTAVMGMSSWGGALLLAGQGLEAVMQVSGRDRNRLALQGDLLAASAMGVKNLLVVRGADPSEGDHHQTRAVYDLEHEEVLQAVHTLCKGHDLAGRELMGSPSFTVGSSLNLWTPGKVGGQVEEFQRKVDSGAEYFITPPIFDVASVKAFQEKLAGSDAKIIPNVLILKSVAMAQAIRLHAKQVHMPDGLISRIKRAKKRVEECLAITSELVRGIREAGFSGVMISPAGWESKVPQLLQSID